MRKLHSNSIREHEGAKDAHFYPSQVALVMTVTLVPNTHTSERERERIPLQRIVGIKTRFVALTFCSSLIHFVSTFAFPPPASVVQFSPLSLTSAHTLFMYI